MAAIARLRKYEAVWITHPDTTEEENEKVWGRVQSVLEAKGAREVRREYWGRRRLAYEVQKQRKGVYHYVMFLAGDDTVAELERNFRIMDRVLRFMTVRLEDSIDAATFDFEGEAQQLTPIGRRANQGEDTSEYRSFGEGRGRDDGGGDEDEDDDDDDN